MPTLLTLQQLCVLSMRRCQRSLLQIKMLSGISNFLFGAAEELCGPSDGAADEPRLKTSPAEDEWVLVDKSSTYFVS